MFLLHPRVGDLINTKSLYSTFSTEGLAGPHGRTLHAQQANRLVAFGHQCLASTGGTGSLCGGAAGPGGGLAGAGSAPFSGAGAVAAGGSNGAAGGVPVGGQDVGRFSNRLGQVGSFGYYLLDDVTEVTPMDANGGSGMMMARGISLEDALDWLISALASLDGFTANHMYHASTYHGIKNSVDTGGPTCGC